MLSGRNGQGIGPMLRRCLSTAMATCVLTVALVVPTDAAEGQKRPPAKRPAAKRPAKARVKQPARAPAKKKGTAADTGQKPRRRPAKAKNVLKRPTASEEKKPAPAKAEEPTKTEAKSEEEPPEEAEPMDAPKGEVKELFADFLHFVKIGKFRIANNFAAALLKHEQATPVALLALSEAYPDSIEVLTIVLANSDVGQNARQVLERINQGRIEKRRDPQLIKQDIAALAGDPRQVLNATQRLQWSGEYAVPWMLEALQDAKRESLHPRILKALPKIGLAAVTPLAIALDTKNEVLKVQIIEALGKIGYPHALPYLKEIIEHEQTGENVRNAAEAAMERIRPNDSGLNTPGSALFHELAVQHYDGKQSLRADPREAEANVWTWRDGVLDFQRVPREIYNEIMAMRCSERALLLRPDLAEAEALWIAANFRREAQLGVADVASEAPVKILDQDVTRPKDYPRAIYFARSAGPRFNHMVLARALKDHDSAVALGAIAALTETAGESSLIGEEDVKQPLVEALSYRNAVVRVEAALALGRALPKSQFAGSQEVVPVLAQALGLTGEQNVMVVEPDTQNLNRVMGILRDAACRVVGEANFEKALAKAKEDLATIDACFLASDISEPALQPALKRLRELAGGRNIPVIILAKGRQMTLTEQLAREDSATGRVLAEQPADPLLREWDRVNRQVGRVDMNPDKALDLAIQAAETLRAIAASNSKVYDVTRAEGALIEAMKHKSPELRILSARALALVPTASAQQGIAAQAFDAQNEAKLRIEMFGALAESGRHNGNKLEQRELDTLVQVVMQEKNLELRAAASQAFGALNVPGNLASKIIRAQHGE